jgi:ketosteroid isomerase-like protein
MSEENVEIVERVFDAVARHDTEAVLDAYDPDIEYDFSGSPLGGLIGDTVYRGHDGMRRWVRDRYEAWERGQLPGTDRRGRTSRYVRCHEWARTVQRH